MVGPPRKIFRPYQHLTRIRCFTRKHAIEKHLRIGRSGHPPEPVPTTEIVSAKASDAKAAQTATPEGLRGHATNNIRENQRASETEVSKALCGIGAQKRTRTSTPCGTRT